MAIEVLEIFGKGSEIRFRLWYRDDGGDLSEFGGPVLHLGDLLWLFGGGALRSSRLRVMNFRLAKNARRKPIPLRLGQMLGEVSHGTSSDPVACPVVLIRMSDINSSQLDKMRGNIGAVFGRDLEGPFGYIVRELLGKMENNRSGHPFGHVLETDKLKEEDAAMFYRRHGLGPRWE